MTHKKILFFVLIITNLFFVNAQQSIFEVSEIISPEINENKTVTFRFFAPNATEVKLTGDWMPSKGWTPGTVNMEKNEQNVWTYTTEILTPELYSYSFLMDGLKTTDPNNAFLIRDIASVVNIFIIEGKQADVYKVNNVAHGSIIKTWYNSPGNNTSRRITIYTPSGYDISNEEFPVLYLLHGAGGDEDAWSTLGRTVQIMDNLIAQGKAKPMVVVMPNGNVSQQAAPGEGIRGFYKPQFMEKGTMNGKYEETFIDIINFVESNYKVKKDKANRAIAGLSMGGFHSLHISRYYPNTFDYIGLFSPAILPNKEATSRVYDSIDKTLNIQKENGYKLYWVAIGKTDFLYKNVMEYNEKLKNMNMPFVYRESEGGHIWKNWRVYLTEFVPMLFNE